MPATVVPTSLATVAIDTFITELSSVMRNCADANVSKIVPDAAAARSVVTLTDAPSHRPDGQARCPNGGPRCRDRLRDVWSVAERPSG
jgi:hypothetical protein